MESQSAASVGGQVSRLPDELIQRKDKAEEQHAKQLVSDDPTLESDNEHIQREPERIRTTADIDLQHDLDVPVFDQAESKKPCSSSPSENATAVLLQDSHDGIETASRKTSAESPERAQGVQGCSKLPGISGIAKIEVDVARVIDTYSFMKHFPHGRESFTEAYNTGLNFNIGIWWTRLDDDQGLSRSLDFGANGFTASLNTGHEILQMTAPDHRYGLVYARVSFADNPDAILARAQRGSGGKSTFGLKWLESIGNYRRGRIEYHGLLNFRWPYKRYALGCPGSFSGTLGSLSFVKDEMVYQILRFQPGPESYEKPAAHVPPSLPPTAPEPQSPTTSTFPTKPEYHDVKVTIGGVMKFGGAPHYLEDAPYILQWEYKSISCHISNELSRQNSSSV
ncbi:hypothetical protein IFR04_011031 [Cadophora malorum]|uniref:Uncharacterized protein n=1 Tax=Cadophora malorum TaxID=108018 RepID=A0A8H7TBK2_9HELO|nr:hypothetical protein IFR04_011031 [Cadophora malorum]